MVKITVKHYLDKRLQDTETRKLNPIHYIKGEKTFIYFDKPRIVYPVYIQISINHKTTKFRSFTKYKLTIEEFEKYKQTGIYKFESSLRGSLKVEVDKVVRILEYLINKKNIDYVQYDLGTLLTFYSREIDNEFYKSACFNSLLPVLYRNNELKPLWGFIEKKINPKEFITYVYTTFKFDLNGYLDKDEILFIDAFDYFIKSLPQVKKISQKPVLIDWYNGNAQKEFNYYLLRNKITLPQRDTYIQLIKDFCAGIEDVFLVVVKGKQNIDTYDNM